MKKLISIAILFSALSIFAADPPDPKVATLTGGVAVVPRSAFMLYSNAILSFLSAKAPINAPSFNGVVSFGGEVQFDGTAIYLPQVNTQNGGNALAVGDDGYLAAATPTLDQLNFLGDVTGPVQNQIDTANERIMSASNLVYITLTNLNWLSVPKAIYLSNDPGNGIVIMEIVPVGGGNGTLQPALEIRREGAFLNLRNYNFGLYDRTENNWSGNDDTVAAIQDVNTLIAAALASVTGSDATKQYGRPELTNLVNNAASTATGIVSTAGVNVSSNGAGVYKIGVTLPLANLLTNGPATNASSGAGITAVLSAGTLSIATTLGLANLLTNVPITNEVSAPGITASQSGGILTMGVTLPLANLLTNAPATNASAGAGISASISGGTVSIGTVLGLANLLTNAPATNASAGAGISASVSGGTVSIATVLGLANLLTNAPATNATAGAGVTASIASGNLSIATVLGLANLLTNAPVTNTTAGAGITASISAGNISIATVLGLANLLTNVPMTNAIAGAGISTSGSGNTTFAVTLPLANLLTNPPMTNVTSSGSAGTASLSGGTLTLTFNGSSFTALCFETNNVRAGFQTNVDWLPRTNITMYVTNNAASNKIDVVIDTAQAITPTASPSFNSIAATSSGTNVLGPTTFTNNVTFQGTIAAGTNTSSMASTTNPVVSGLFWTNTFGQRGTLTISYTLTSSASSGFPSFGMTNIANGDAFNATNNIALAVINNGRQTFRMSPGDWIVATNLSTGSASASLAGSYFTRE